MWVTRWVMSSNMAAIKTGTIKIGVQRFNHQTLASILQK
jgi:hypothetical protein